MSSSPANEIRSALNDAESLVQSRDSLLAPVRRISFWVAVSLPFLYVPMLVSGLEGAATTTAFVTLLICNAVALLLGHPYHRD